ncbi:MAG: hypothetical protein HUU38_02415 [Anaerolineales bacterium]|nr:hypothetical protein [Anaerolineales bacterium]
MMMTKKWHKILFVALLFAVAALAYQVWFTAPASAAGNVAQVWHNVQRSDSYAFTASVENKSIPLATIGNIGRFSKTTSLYLEGQNNLRDDELQLAIWGGGVNVLDQSSAYQMHLSDGRVQTRVGDGEWQDGSDLNVGMAPGGDFLAFLDVATDVTIADNSANPEYTIYQFNVDGRAYAQRLNQISQEYLVHSGQLPNGVALQVPDHMKAITGSGELWVDADGLPAREIVTLNIPAAEGADYRTEATLDVQFSQYEGTTLLTLWQQPGRVLARLVSSLPTAAQAGLSLTALFALAGFMVVIIRPTRKTQRVIITVLVSLIFASPLMQARAADVASDKIATFQARQEASAARTEAQTFVNTVQQPFVPPAQVQQPSDDADADGDGLFDATEALLGTSALRADTDFDTISDLDEITGFDVGGQTWYGNPTVADSNGDSILDGLEWELDTDGDNTPDLYDLDDDGDGVPDTVDLSRLVASETDGGTAVTFTRATPLELNIPGLNFGSYTYVDVQLRPTNPDHLWYAFNVHNWPKDELGNMQDWDGATFFDHCVATSGTNCTMSPNANGDIKFVPMLEVTLPDLSNLPHTSNGELDTALLSQYNIAIQPAGGGSYYAYVPLNIVEDPVTGAKVAFQGKLIYQAAASWTPQQARLVWTVNVLNESYKDAEAAQKIIQNGGGMGQNKTTVLHAYDDDFTLTGLNVHESRGQDMAIVYENPAVDASLDDDDGLMQLARGLENTYFVNRDCDFVDNEGECVGDGERDITIPEIALRWNYETNTGITDSQRWGIPDQLSVETYSFSHEDEAVFTAGGELAPQILNTHFTGSGVQIPNLLFVRETRLRAMNANARTLTDTVTWTDHTLTADLTAETVITTVGYNLTPYRYNTTLAAWETYPIADYADHVRATYAATDAGLGEGENDAEAMQATALLASITMVTVTIGNSAVVSTNTNSGTLSSFFQTSALTGINLSDDELRADYHNALQTGADRVVQLVRYFNRDLFSMNDLRVLLGLTLDNYDRYNLPSWTTGNANADQISQAHKSWYGFTVINAMLAVAGLASILAMHIKGGRVVGEVLAHVVGAVGAVLDAATTIAQISNAVIGGTAQFSLTTMAVFQKAIVSINTTAVKASLVGAVIGIGISWIVFFAAWGSSGIAAGSVEFNTLIAGAIASTITALLTFILSLTIVGSIFLAVVAVFDLIAFIICKAGVRGACDFGIATAMLQAITDWIYQGEVMIDLSGDPAISNIDDLDMTLTDSERGLVVGNGVRFTADMFTFIRHNQPKPSVVYHYGSFYTPQDLQSTTIQYTLGPVKQTIKPQLNQMTWQWGAVYPYLTVENLVPSPGVAWLVPTMQSKTLWQAANYSTITSPVYNFDTPQINRNFSLWLNTGMALPRYDCWFTACSHGSVQAPANTDLSKNFYLDILPNTLDGFYSWDALGVQKDFDGDGIPASQDPYDRDWDTDHDGLDDLTEIEYGSSPTIPDKDNDGLTDLQEIRSETNPNAADTDGDGLTDAVEVNGYLLTIDGHSFRITSNPLDRDGDKDGISDGAERRLNQLDPVLYPFHPGVINDSPVRLYTDFTDDDLVLAVSAQTTVTTTVFSGLKTDSLLATGAFTSTLPTQLGGTTVTDNFTLLPNGSATLTQLAIAQPANETVTVTTSVAASIIPIGNPPPPTNSDIILDDPIGVTIDSDNPDAPTLTLGAFLEPGVDVIIGGTATDPTSYVALVEVSVNGSAYLTATGTSLWAFPISVPNAPSGTTIPITVRATDAVGHTTSDNFSLTIDGDAPTTTVNLAPNETRVLRRNADGDWTLALSGSSNDALAGIDEVSVQIGASHAVTVTDPTGDWDLIYPFDDPHLNNTPNPNLPLTMTLTTRDNSLPGGNAVTQVIPFIVDMSPPVVELLSHGDDYQLLDGMVLTGTVRDNNTALSNLEIAFLPAATVFATSETLLRLPLNDLPETVLFNNTASGQTRIYCLDVTCPTSYVPGADGTAISLDGNDLLRSFEDLTLPATDRTIALWFNTTCDDCGLFSMVQGDFPTITEHNQDIFLDNGKVCTSFLTGGANRELRCSVTDTYADGQWHQIVHTLGGNGNHLYVDGELAVSSPTTASIFTTPDGVLIGYSPAAATPYLTGRLDDVVVYGGDMTADIATTLYRQWQPVTLIPGATPLEATWAYTVPLGIEGYYQIDMRAADAIGNQNDNRGEWPQFRGPIDTAPPSFDVSVGYSGSGSAAQTLFSGTVHDANLSTTDYAFVCDLANASLIYETDPIEFAFTQTQNDQLTTISSTCTQNGYQSSQISLSACDEFGHCAAAVPPQTVAYVGTANNALKPNGTLPNGIERTVLSDPANREMLIERPGKIITDLAIDETHGKIYWGEMANGPYNQPAAIWRADLDGSNIEEIVPNLNAYAPEALQIALDPAGNKLYWTKGYQLWWANLDGTLPQMIYAVPDDPGFIGGNREYHHIGDVAVDSENGRLILSERRLRFDRPVPGVTIFNHSLLVSTQLNGTAPEFIAGVDAGCTYANFYQNVGSGLDPILCVDETGGMDVESVTAVNGTAYWTATAPNWTNAGVHMQPFGGTTASVAPLDLNSDFPGVRTNPLPQLYVPPTGTAVYVAVGQQIVRGEPGSEFTVFSSFYDDTPAPVGTQERLKSDLTALAVIQTPQAVQTQPDLSVSMTSPTLVMLNGDTARYDVTLRNYSGLPADSTTLTLNLPTGATFVSSDGSCSAVGLVVTCDFGRFPAFGIQKIGITFTINVASVTQLQATALIAGLVADANPNDNTTTSASITAAPDIASLPGVPYVYYSEANNLMRVPLIGDPNPEPIFFDNNGIGGPVFAIDNVRGYAFIVNDPSDVVRVNLDGTGYTVIGDANPGNVPTQDGTLSVAVDTNTGRVYWTEVVTMIYTRIRSANNDGSDVQTVVPIVYGQKGIVFDPIRNLLYWVGMDSQQRQFVIYRANPDGSDVQTMYVAPEGALIRDLNLDPYGQKFYWLDGATNDGTLYRADSDGGNLTELDIYMGSDARGVVVLPQQNTIYYTKWESLWQAELDGANATEVVWLGNHRYYGVSNLNPLVFPFHYINPPQSNLAFGLSTSFAPSPCLAADTNEFNDTIETATLLTPGTYTAALCRSTSEPLGVDKDIYQIVVPAGQAVTATLSTLPANYGMYIQRDDYTVDVSNETGTTTEQVTAANDQVTDPITYTLTVFNSEGGNNPATYQLDVELGPAPFTGYTDAQCLAVDPNDLPGNDGNHTIANATPMTIGTAATGALCYENDTDFYTFNATAGQVIALDLPVRPADYSLFLYAPDGTFQQAFTAPNYGQQVTLNTTGAWSVLVRDNVLVPTTQTYQLLVTDLTCSLHDAYEPNNVIAQAANLTGMSRVFASLCAATDLDFYTFQSSAAQQLTVNYPTNAADATLTLLGANGELGRVDPGTQAQFTLADAGWYTFTVGNSSFSGTDALYMFQWQVAAPTAPITGTPYIYYTDANHLTRVALSDDHIVEPLFIENGGVTWDTVATDATRGWLYYFDITTNEIARTDLYGTNQQVVIPNANPEGVGAPHVAIAVDEESGRIYWLQPTGAIASTASFIMRSNGDGTGTTQVVGNGPARDSLVVDSIQGYLYWTENDVIWRSDLDGNGATTLYTGGQIRDLTLDPYAHRLYWLDPAQQTLFRAASDGSNVTALITGLDANVRGLVVRPFENTLYYSNGAAMMRAQLDGTGVTAIAALSGTYLGPSNLNPAAYLNTPIGTPNSNLAFGYDAPIVNPCVLSDSYEPNNDSGTATPLTVVTETVVYGSLCNGTLPNPTDQDYYHVTLDDQKVLTVTLSQLPADYRVIVIDGNGLAAAFSDNPGLADEQGVVRNSSGAPVEFDILVMSGSPVQNSEQYQLTLTLGSVPPPPIPGDESCYYADPYDAPAPGGNGTLATATDLPLDIPLTAALCYTDDVDMYGFDGIPGQQLTIDLPVRPADYALTLYDPSGAAWSTPAYGDLVTLDAVGRWTIAVSHSPLTPTTDNYQLLVTDESCLISDANEPNNSVGQATTLTDGNRVRASLCSDSDVDSYRIFATAGQQLTINYATNATSTDIAVSGLGNVVAGTQGQFDILADGWIDLTVTNASLTERAVPYLFQVTLGAPVGGMSTSPYLYYSNASDLTRVAVITRTIEPILLGDGNVGGITIASDQTIGKLYVLDHFERIVRTNFDGSGTEIIIPDADPNNVLRFANGLAVDEFSGRIYWMQPQFGLVSNLMSANGDGSDVQTLVTNIVAEQTLAVDPVGGWLYWVEGNLGEQIKRANLDGSDVTVIYAAPDGREIRDLAVDPYTQKLYWLDPTLNQLLWADSDGSDADVLATMLASPARGIVVRPLANALYYTSGLSLLQAALDGSNPTELARLEGSYYGVSNLDPNVFYPTGFTTPSSNLALGWSVPYAQPCSDSYEPNGTPGTATVIGVGTINSVLCTNFYNQPDTQDYFQVSVPDGQQLDVTLSDLPQDYGLSLQLNGTWVDWSYVPGLVDEAVTAVNTTGSAADYTILVERFGGANSSNVPYTLNVGIADPPPAPPLPPPPGDPCAAVDIYDAPGALGNGSQGTATLIAFNTPLTAALCYDNDADYYAFDGVIGQNVTIDLPTRPADYYVIVYRPDGSYYRGIFPGSGLTYGDSVTLNESGTWKVAVWQPGLIPTTDTYQLLLGVNAACSGLDPYEPNNEQFNPYDFGTTPPATISAMLCELDDLDYFTFDVTLGQHLRVDPRILTPGMEMIVGIPGGGFYFTTESVDQVVRQSGQVTIGAYSQEATENLPYEFDIQLDDAPTPTPLPDNWSCTVYPSGSLTLPIEPQSTIGSVINVPVAGTVTHVGIRDIIFDHGGLYGLNFGLGAPDGTTLDLFSFGATNQFPVWCGGPNCWLSLDDGAIPGLIPPQFPNTGGTYQPNLSTFEPFNGLSSQGDWTLLISSTTDFYDEGGPIEGDLFSWSLEVCVDNGIPVTPTPTPSPTNTPTPPPAPINGTPTPPAATETPSPTPSATAPSCVAPADDYEADDSAGTAALFDHGNRNSGNHTFHTVTDMDWMQFHAVADREYTFNANQIGSDTPITLALYESDGTILITKDSNSVTFTPTATGDYYLTARSSAGIVSPCNSSYTVALTVSNPSATPVPMPVGTPVPPDHDRPEASSAILSPESGLVVTAVAPITVDVGLAADSGINAAVLRVNGTVVANYLAPPPTHDATWQPTWSPASTGVYTLTADITASNGITGTSPAIVVYVDTADPSVSVVTEAITLATLREDGVYGLHGTVSDDSAVADVEVQINGGAWQQAALDGGNWLFEIAPLAEANPDGGTLTANVRVTDVAGRTGTANANFTVDVIPPGAFVFDTTLTSGETISPTQITTGLDTRVSWPVITGTVNMYAGWTNVLTPTLASLTQYGAGAGTHDAGQAEASVMYAHVVAVDANGNETAITRGPYYFDTAETPDWVSDLSLDNWTESGGKQVGQMNGTDFGAQKLFAGWNANDLRLRWEGVNVNGSGDLYFYLGTGGSGTTALLNPFGAEIPGVLPFSADYAVYVSDTTATLYTVSGGVWTAGGSVAVTSLDQITDILLPFAELGIANSAGATVQLLGVASAEDALDVWATVPDKNLGQPSWTQYIEWAAMGNGVVPADGVWADTQLDTAITSNPAPTTLVGAGDTITLTLTYSNTGTATLPQLTFDGISGGGITLTNNPQMIANVPPGGTGTLTLLGTVSGDGSVSLTLADSYHRPYALGDFTYTMDSAAPEAVEVTLDYVGTLTNTISVTSDDESPLSLVEVEINDGLLSGPQAIQIVTCVPGSGTGDAFVCDWDAGVVTDGHSYTMRARAADVHGNTSAWSAPITVIGDATLPTLTISTATQNALSDGQLNRNEMTFDGTLVDERTAVSVQACITQIILGEEVDTCNTTFVLSDDSWSLSLPGVYNGVNATLTIVGFDGAGNPSNLVSQTVWVDTVAPVMDEFVTPILVNVVGNDPALFANGTVFEASGLATVQAIMILPDGSSVLTDGTVNGNAWEVSYLFAQGGAYEAVVLLTDDVGNQTFSEVWTFSVTLPGQNLLTVALDGTGSGTVTSDPAGIDCGTDCTEVLNDGTVITLTATADTSSIFSGWSGACTGTNDCVITIADTTNVTATFTLNEYALNVTLDGTGSGTVTSNPAGIDCGTDCSELFGEGTVVTLSALALPGSTFAGWGGACTGVGDCVVTMNSTTDVMATFTLNEYALNVTLDGTGLGTVTSNPTGIDCGADCSETFAYGTVVTLTAVADPSSTFTGWSGACSGTGDCVVTMTNTTDVMATFALNQPNQYALNVTLEGVGNGLVTSVPAGIACGTDCAETFAEGTVVTLTAIAETDSSFIGWSGACSGMADCVVTMNSSQLVKATFVLRPINDDLVNAIIIDSLPFADANNINNQYGSLEANETPPGCGTFGTNSVWWAFTPDTDGFYKISTDGSSFDTVLSVWTGGEHPLTEVDCDDDSGEGFRSMLNIPMTAGETYYIRIDGWKGVFGDVSLSVEWTPLQFQLFLPIVSQDLYWNLER